MSFVRYPKYKNSGVEWLGEVPVHWSIFALKRVSPQQTVGIVVNPSEYVAEDGLPFIYGGDISEGRIDHMASRRISPEDSQRNEKTRLQAGDLLTVRVGAPGITAVVPPECEGGNCASVMLVRRGEFNSDWLCFVMNSRVVRYQVEIVQYGAAQEQFNINHAVDFLIPTPLRREQDAIAAFLNHETAKIDALVAEQEKLIALLQEKRQAVISHAVTKGLNPNVPMKDSGVEWLGEVPEHWAVGKCGFYLRILSGFAFPSSGFTDDDSDHRLLRGANVGVSRLKWDDTVYWQRSEGDGLDDYEMVEGDLVIGMDRPLIGEGMRVAKVTAEDLPSLLLQRVASLKVGSKLHADYLHYLLASEMFIAHFSPETTGVSVPHISPDQINKFIIPIPPMSEQLAIVNDVKRLLTEFGGLIAESEIAITLLQERRSALISAAVTGQIDVRNWSVSESA